MIVRSTTNGTRRAALKETMRAKPCIRVMEIHNPLSAIVAENACVLDDSGSPVEFDAFWSSSLTDSTSRGLPDNEVLSARVRLSAIDDAFSVTSKPLIMDGDTGGPREHLELTVRDLDRHGVSALIIEDKSGVKQNSLLGTSSRQQLAAVEEFCDKIRAGKAAQVTDDFQLFARLESFCLGYSLDDALARAEAYVDAGVDGIMIHSRKPQGDEVFQFAEAFRSGFPDTPLIAVPTTYHSVHFHELERAGFNVVIYANHMLRAALKAMNEVCHTILTNDRAAEAERLCADLSDVLHVERWAEAAKRPASGDGKAVR